MYLTEAATVTGDILDVDGGAISAAGDRADEVYRNIASVIDRQRVRNENARPASARHFG